MQELITIQSKLKANKSQFNKFGGYYYRSAEDILEAVKPLLAETNCTLIISDDIVSVADRIYVCATATLTNKEGKCVKTSAYAREPQAKKGMDESQVTGATSSYARKYALNGLFAIDDTKDADATNTHGKDTAPAQAKPTAAPASSAKAPKEVIDEIELLTSIPSMQAYWNKYPQYQKDHEFSSAMTARRKYIEELTKQTNNK